MSDPDARVPRFQAGARYDRYGITSLTGDSFLRTPFTRRVGSKISPSARAATVRWCIASFS